MAGWWDSKVWQHSNIVWNFVSFAAMLLIIFRKRGLLELSSMVRGSGQALETRGDLAAHGRRYVFASFCFLPFWHLHSENQRSREKSSRLRVWTSKFTSTVDTFIWSLKTWSLVPKAAKVATSLDLSLIQFCRDVHFENPFGTTATTLSASGGENAFEYCGNHRGQKGWRWNLRLRSKWRHCL